jgi:hypothetical protein
MSTYALWVSPEGKEIPLAPHEIHSDILPKLGKGWIRVRFNPGSYVAMSVWDMSRNTIKRMQDIVLGPEMPLKWVEWDVESTGDAYNLPLVDFLSAKTEQEIKVMQKNKYAHMQSESVLKEKWFSNLWGADIFKNPSPKELSECVNDDQARAILFGRDIYVWDAFKAVHFTVQKKLNLSENAITVILRLFRGKIDEVYVTDSVSRGPWNNNPSVIGKLRSHPYLKLYAIPNFKISFYNEAIVGDWKDLEQAPVGESLIRDAFDFDGRTAFWQHDSGERIPIPNGKTHLDIANDKYPDHLDPYVVMMRDKWMAVWLNRDGSAIFSIRDFNPRAIQSIQDVVLKSSIPLTRIQIGAVDEESLGYAYLDLDELMSLKSKADVVKTIRARWDRVQVPVGESLTRSIFEDLSMFTYDTPDSGMTSPGSGTMGGEDMNPPESMNRATPQDMPSKVSFKKRKRGLVKRMFGEAIRGNYHDTKAWITPDGEVVFLTAGFRHHKDYFLHNMRDNTPKDMIEALNKGWIRISANAVEIAVEAYKNKEIISYIWKFMDEANIVAERIKTISFTYGGKEGVFDMDEFVSVDDPDELISSSPLGNRAVYPSKTYGGWP